MQPFYVEKAAGFESSRRDSTLSMARSIRSINHHNLGDRPSCLGPAVELDGKLRNSPRRRVPVAVSITLQYYLYYRLTLLSSANGVERERSNVVVTPVTDRAAPTAVVLATRIANFCEYGRTT